MPDGGDCAPVLLAVDGNSLVHRAFHAFADPTTSGSGQSSWAVRGLLTQLVAAVERVDADAVLVGFDDPQRSIRRETWPQYKANRSDKPESLISQLLLAARVLRELGVAVVVPDGLEADDVLCSAAAYARTTGTRTVIMTSDRDSFALIDDNTRVLRIINGGVEASPVLTADRLFMMLGVRPDQYQDFAALRGDPSDNLPGVAGVGPKTAARLLAEFGDAASIFADDGARITALVGAGMAAKLADPQARQRWVLNCQVMQMRPDIDLPMASGAGRLPLAEVAVRAAFSVQQLIASSRPALRVLARCEVPATEVRVAIDSHRVPWARTGPVRYAAHRRLPVKPKVDQLALF